jgi:hypothetical protein
MLYSLLAYIYSVGYASGYADYSQFSYSIDSLEMHENMLSVMSDIMYKNKCVNSKGAFNIPYTAYCEPDSYHFINTLFTVFFSVTIGLGASLLCVAHTMSYDNEAVVDGCDDDVVDECDDDVVYGCDDDVVDDESQKKMEDNERFNSLPVDGYVIHSYPFVYKKVCADDSIVMILNVYNDDYKTNDASIEYTYYSKSNTLTLYQLLDVAKQIAIDLNTQQFYKDTTIKYGVRIDAPMPEPEQPQEKEPNEDTETPDAVVPEPVIEKSYSEPEPADDSVFARFKKYNKSSHNNSTSMSDSTSDKSSNNKKTDSRNNLNTKDTASGYTPSRMRRVGTMYDYKTLLMNGINTKDIKSVSFREFKNIVLS